MLSDCPQTHWKQVTSLIRHAHRKRRSKGRLKIERKHSLNNIWINIHYAVRCITTEPKKKPTDMCTKKSPSGSCFLEEGSDFTRPRRVFVCRLLLLQHRVKICRLRMCYNDIPSVIWSSTSQPSSSRNVNNL